MGDIKKVLPWSIKVDDNLPSRVVQAVKLEQLRTLLVDPEILGVSELRQQITKLEHQIQDPVELINLLLPVITELLTRKVVESGERVAQALAPIIDETIRKKIQQDKVAVAKTLAPIISDAIRNQIQASRGEIATVLAPVISAAISKQVNEASDEVAKALAPVMGAAIKEQVNSQRDEIIDALYPVIGSTIAKYMSETMKRLIDSINQNLQDAITLKGLSRKMRARVRGVPEAELILRDSIPFIPRAAFLIHKASGLLMVQTQRPGDEILESDLVAGMLTAIRNFVNDWIARSGDVSELDKINYGGSKIILEVAGYCYLALVGDGEPGERFLSQMRETLAGIVQRFDKSIEAFQGDSSTIPQEISYNLRKLVDVQANQLDTRPPSKSYPIFQIISVVLLGVILILSGTYWYRNHVDRRIEAKTIEVLASAPELAIYRLNVDVRRDVLHLSGLVPHEYLRQRAEQIAKEAAPALKLDNAIRAVEVPADPVLAAAEVERATSTLNKMEGVAISARYQEGHVTVEGTVFSPLDIEKVTKTFEQIPGVRTLTTNIQARTVVAATEVERVVALLNKTEGISISARYEEGHVTVEGTVPSPSDIENLSKALQQIPQVQTLTVRVQALTELAPAEVERVTFLLNQMEGTSISTQYKEGHVTVEGIVPTPGDVKRITEAFEQIPGVRALTANVQTITALAAAEVERMVTTLNEMEGVSILARYQEGHVTVEGTVFSPSDIEKITKAFEQIRGVQAITANVRPEQLVRSTRIYFDFASSQLKPLEADKILKIKEFLIQYPDVNLKLIGHTDPTGGIEENRQLSMGRAEAVRAALVAQGVETSRLQIEGIPGPPPDIDVTQSMSLGRCVRFEFVETTGQGR